MKLKLDAIVGTLSQHVDKVLWGLVMTLLGLVGVLARQVWSGHLDMESHLHGEMNQAVAELRVQMISLELRQKEAEAKAEAESKEKFKAMTEHAIAIGQVQVIAGQLEKTQCKLESRIESMSTRKR